MRDQVAGAFEERYGRTAEVVIRSPGRVNLIGDHTDYNDGFVLPIAIEQATWIAAAPRSDRVANLTSLDLGSARVTLDHLEPTHTWVDYVAGTIKELGVDLAGGFDAVLGSTLPVGAGLSSSASLELAIARLIAALGHAEWQPVAAAQAAMRAENDFVGMPCGVMDQLIVAGGLAGRATLIDCRSLDVRPARVPVSTTVVIMDTGTRRRLVESAYEERRRSCRRAAAALGVPALRDATLEMIDSGRLDAVLARRARHVVTENARTLAAAEALEQGKPDVFGRLMNESHASLRDDFEVSSSALDAISALARRHPGCHGARVTGGGFAGCAVALVASDSVDAFIASIGPEYDAATGHTSVLYPTSPAAGVAVI